MKFDRILLGNQQKQGDWPTLLTINKTRPVTVSNTDSNCKVFQLTKSSTIIETEEVAEAGLLNSVPTSYLGMLTKYQT